MIRDLYPPAQKLRDLDRDRLPAWLSTVVLAGIGLAGIAAMVGLVLMVFAIVTRAR